MKTGLWIFFCALLAAWVRCHTLHEVFVENRVYFQDGDCYSRMTRARLIERGGIQVVRWHRFENFPAGVQPHTTAPLDYLIVGLRHGVDGVLALADPGRQSVLRGQELDVAGALVSPLLGIATCLFLGWWASRILLETPARWGWAVPLLFAISPVLVHGTVLGRPDHQSLLILLLAIALAAEERLLTSPGRGWSVVGGLSWGLALWVSLYEPLVLFGGVLGLWLAFNRPGWRAPGRIAWAIALGSVVALAWWVEGWRNPVPAPEMLGYFANWRQSIGELAHARLADVCGWLGFGAVVGPALLFWVGRTRRFAWALLALLVFLGVLTGWQARWGYFLALVFVMALPWQLALFRRSWVGGLAFALALWPVAREWDSRLFPGEAAEQQRQVHRQESVLLREIAGKMEDAEERAFLAPWWISPALAYWSDQPGVAGSSHQSLPGIVDTARFYLAGTQEEAGTILRSRHVAWVVADEASRVISTSNQLLGGVPPEQPLATALIEQPHSVGEFLVPVFANDYFKLFAVKSSKLPR